MNLESLTSRFAFVVTTLALLAPAAGAGPIPEWGIKGGLSIADIRGGLQGTERLLSFGAGGYVNFGLPGGLSVQPEVLYVTKGTSYGKTEETSPSGTVLGTSETLVVLEYVEIPMLLRWSPPTPGIVHPSFVLGPAFSFRVRSRLKITGYGEGSASIDDQTKSTDVGLAFGGGAGIGHGRRKILVDARYTVGLTNVADRTFADSSKNGNFLLMMGVAF